MCPKRIYPEGVAQHSPGSRVRERTLGQPWKVTIYPEGVTHAGNLELCNPFGVLDTMFHVTQGALADSRPWAGLSNAFGVKHLQWRPISPKFGTTECGCVLREQFSQWQSSAGAATMARCRSFCHIYWPVSLDSSESWSPTEAELTARFPDRATEIISQAGAAEKLSSSGTCPKSAPNSTLSDWRGESVRLSYPCIFT